MLHRNSPKSPELPNLPIKPRVDFSFARKKRRIQDSEFNLNPMNPDNARFPIFDPVPRLSPKRYAETPHFTRRTHFRRTS